MTASRYLLDTNLCIYIAKRRPPAVARRFATLAAGSIARSAITWGELCFGAERSDRREQSLETMRALAEIIPVLGLTPAVGDAYGRLRARLERAGKPTGNNDQADAPHREGLGEGQ